MTQKMLPKSLNDILNYSAHEELIYRSMCGNMGIEPKTTFWSDFSIAECHGVNSIKDTFKRASKEWLSNVEMYKYMVLVINWKSWEWYDREGETSEIGQLYSDFYYKARDKGYDTYEGDELSEFWQFLD